MTSESDKGTGCEELMPVDIPNENDLSQVTNPPDQLADLPLIVSDTKESCNTKDVDLNSRSAELKMKTKKTDNQTMKRSLAEDKAKCPSATPMTNPRQTHRRNRSSRAKPTVPKQTITSYRTPKGVVSKVAPKKKTRKLVEKRSNRQEDHGKSLEIKSLGGTARTPFPSAPKKKKKRKLYGNVKSRLFQETKCFAEYKRARLKETKSRLKRLDAKRKLTPHGDKSIDFRKKSRRQKQESEQK